MPGPGNYDEMYSFGKSGMAVGIQGKRKDDRDKHIPGPGSYE
jgi:hypothetical protein